MNAPVTTAAPGGAPARPRAPPTPGGAHSAAPFASALDGALHESRAVRPRRRPAQHAGGPGGSAPTRAADAKDQRIDDRGRAADQRAATRRPAPRPAAGAPSRGHGRGRGGDRRRRAADATPGRPVDDATVPDEVAPETDDETTDAAGRSAEAPRGGLPALWALLMGGSLATAPVEDAAPEAGARRSAAGRPGRRPAAAACPRPRRRPRRVPADADGGPGRRRPPPRPPARRRRPSRSRRRPRPPPPPRPARACPPASPPSSPRRAPAVTASGTPGTTAAATAAAPTPVPALPVDLVLDAAPATGTPVPTRGAGRRPVAGPPVAADGDGASPRRARPPLTPSSPPRAARPARRCRRTPAAPARPAADDAPPAPGATGQPTVGPATLRWPPRRPRRSPTSTAPPGRPRRCRSARRSPARSPSSAAAPTATHSMTLVLTPDTLGEVQVQVTLTKGAIELALRGAHEHGRAALLDGAPRAAARPGGGGAEPVPPGGRPRHRRLAAGPAADPAAGLRRARRSARSRREPVTTLGSPCRYRRERAVPDPEPFHVVRRGRARLRRS